MRAGPLAFNCMPTKEGRFPSLEEMRTRKCLFSFPAAASIFWSQFGGKRRETRERQREKETERRAWCSERIHSHTDDSRERERERKEKVLWTFSSTGGITLGKNTFDFHHQGLFLFPFQISSGRFPHKELWQAFLFIRTVSIQIRDSLHSRPFISPAPIAFVVS